MARLPILMYHNVCCNKEASKSLTIDVDKLEEQFKFLIRNNYKTIHFSELQNYSKINPLPSKTVIITFDDVYVSQLELAYPLLVKYKLKASFFVPFKYINEVDSWNTGKEKIMSVNQLKTMNPDVVELGLHSFKHQKYNELSITQIEEDFEACKMFISNNRLPIHDVLAYPYGKYPRKNPKQDEFFNCLEKYKIKFGLRIGNRVNKFPFKDKYQVERIDIKGEDSLLIFKLKLRFGKLRLF